MAVAENNKRIFKNTIMLYIRMFLMMAISLYTSRVVLNTLGIDDYGIYNIVGGVVVLFTFINSAMVGATQRFLNFGMGQQDENLVAKIFSISLFVHFVLALFILLIGETVGLWFLHEYIKIPEERCNAAYFVYHCCIAITFISVLRAPYNASIIAYEKMSFYAYVSIVEAILKLLIVYLLVILPYDKLEAYAILLLVVTLIIALCYKWYCNKYFSVTHYHMVWDKKIIKEILSFSGWSLFGSAATVGLAQGLNILQNLFFGVTVNAAMGIAGQVSGVVCNFCSNFQMAFKPQLVKLYASKDYSSLLVLVYRSSKLSYYLLFILSLPIIIFCKDLLTIWLGDFPAYATSFTQLMLVYYLLEGLSAPLWMIVQAVGRIKKYQLVISAVLLLNLPISYLVLKMGSIPQYVLVIQVLIAILVYAVRILFVRSMLTDFSIIKYLYKVVLPCSFVTIFSLLISSLVTMGNHSIYMLIMNLMILVFSVSLIIVLVGLDKNERKNIFSWLLTRVRL